MARRMSTSAKLAVLIFAAFFDNFTQIPMISPYATELGASAVMAGWIVGVYSLTNVIGNIGAGVVIDRLGRRIPLAVGLFWAGLGVWMYGFVGTPLGLFGARAFHGLGGSVLVPAIFTVAADAIPAENRGQAMGRIGSMIGVAAILGPMFSGIVRQVWGPKVVFTSVFIVMALCAFYALTLPETLRREKEEETSSTGDMRSLFSAIPFQVASAAGFGIAFNLGALTLMLPLQMEQLGFPASRSGTVFSVFAVVAVIVMLTAGRLNNKRTMLASGFFSIALGFTVLAFGSSFLAISVGMGFYGLGFGFTFPTLNSQIAVLYGKEARGRAYGIFYAFYSLGVVIAPPLVGWLIGFTNAHVVYGALAVIAGVASLLLFQFRNVLAAQMQKMMA